MTTMMTGKSSMEADLGANAEANPGVTIHLAYLAQHSMGTLDLGHIRSKVGRLWKGHHSRDQQDWVRWAQKTQVCWRVCLEH